jgi:hypothetical protein
MKTIILHNETINLFKDSVISLGYNMKGKYTITKSILCHDGLKFFVKNGGINILTTEKELPEFYLDTPQNRKILRNICNEKNK